MGRFEKGNTGRPKGAKGKSPRKEDIIKLLDYITKDLNDNAHKLTFNQRIKILTTFRQLYIQDELTKEEENFFKEITVKIISNNEEPNDKQH